LSVQPGLRGSNDLRVGRKMATFQLFFSVGSVYGLISTHLYEIQRRRVGHIAKVSCIKMGGTYSHDGALKRQQIIKNKN